MFPPHILQQAATTPVALESYLRLAYHRPGEGVIGRVWQTGQPVCLNDLAEAPELAKLRGSSLSAPPRSWSRRCFTANKTWACSRSATAR